MRWSIFSNRNSAVGSTDVEVGLRDDAHAEVVEGTGQEAGEGGCEGHSSIATRKSDANLFFEKNNDVELKWRHMCLG